MTESNNKVIVGSLVTKDVPLPPTYPVSPSPTNKDTVNAKATFSNANKNTGVNKLFTNIFDSFSGGFTTHDIQIRTPRNNKSNNTNNFMDGISITAIILFTIRSIPVNIDVLSRIRTYKSLSAINGSPVAFNKVIRKNAS